MSGRDDEPEGRNFLSRWSRMKREAGRPAEPAPEEAAAPISAEPALQEAIDEDAITDEEIAALPPVESVTDRAGLDPFFRKGVPAALRNAARRRMWMMNPKIANYLDVARDYAYDWNTPGGVPGSGGPLAPGMAAALVEKMISRGEWRKLAEEKSAEDLATAPDTGEETGTASDGPPEVDAAAAHAEAAEPEEKNESLHDESERQSRAAPTDAVSSTSTFVQYTASRDPEAEPEGEPPAQLRRHGRATPR